MLGILKKVAPADVDQQDDAAKRLKRIKSVNNFLGDVVDAVKDTPLVEATAEALPWAAPVAKAVADAVAPIRFVVKLTEKLTKISDPSDLGYLACTLAYQQSVGQAVREVMVNHGQTDSRKKVLKDLRGATPPEAYDFTGFSFSTAHSSQFFVDASEYLRQFADGLALDAPAARRLQNEVRMRFVPNLKRLLSHDDTRNKFAPFTQLMQLETEEQRSYAALTRHADYQAEIYERKPVLGQEPFALAHVYADTDCVSMEWQEIREQRKESQSFDIFDESVGKRKPLLDTVLTLLEKDKFDEAIVIQGVAGSGKSSFTLRLCAELSRLGFQPIRIELKHLDTTTTVAEALPKAVMLEAGELNRDANLFLDDKIFQDTIVIEESGVTICPYVLILDGWDEIDITASAGYQQQVEKTLHEVRNRFLEGRTVPVRVILTGRPTDAVEQSRFLRDDTVVLTVLPLKPKQLRSYVAKVERALVERPLPIEVDPTAAWTLADSKAGVKSLLEVYKEDFKRLTNQKDGVAPGNDSSEDRESVEILGLPLLAFLTLRLVSEWPAQQVAQLLQNTSILYRSMVDLLIGKGGKPGDAEYEAAGRPHIVGDDLRLLLQKTAEAITVRGGERVPPRELTERLWTTFESLSRDVQQFDEEFALSRLMISFLFKGGQPQLGCEFCHKSFREYLYAEQVIETLKAFGRTDGELNDRGDYWKDYREEDPRFTLSRELAAELGPQWITREVGRHLTHLIEWEIARSWEKDDLPVVGDQTEALSQDEWKRVRDGLADLWDWWGEGVHLRPQPRKEMGKLEHSKPLALKVVEADRPWTWSASDPLPIPTRIAAIDAHLGDGIFNLAADVHREIAFAEGWWENPEKWNAASAWQGSSEVGDGPRRYQTSITQGDTHWVVFAPSGAEPDYFRNYIQRIAAAGYRHRGTFPTSIDMSATDLRGTILYLLPLSGRFRYTNLSESDLTASWLSYSDFRNALLAGVRLDSATLCEANFGDASLEQAIMIESNLANSRFAGAKLDHARLMDTNFSGVDFEGASFEGANLEGANLEGAIGLDVERLKEQTRRDKVSQDVR